MSKTKKASASEDGAGKPKKPFPIPKGTLIALAALIPACYLAYGGYTRWIVFQRSMKAKEAETAALLARNAQLSPAFEILQNRKFSICNRTPDSVNVHWVGAAFHDGRRVWVFDSERCADWKEIVIPSGGNKVLNLSSSQPGCNWNGNVMYFAMQYTRESEEESIAYDFVGVFNRGESFDRDCYNVE